MSQTNTPEVFILRASDLPGSGPRLLWAAPGSLFAGDVSQAWTRAGHLADLRSVTGPWAVALWDPRLREHLLVTDPMGVQPLFWARTREGHIVAASWLAQLVDLPGVDDAVDYEGVLLDQGWSLGGPSVLHRTHFLGVSRVPWGRALRIKPDGTTRLEQYWDPAELPGPDNALSLADSAALLRERIEAAIRRLTPTDAPAGAHISGGLDCTAVACRAHQILGERGGGLVAGYSWAPDERHVPRFPGDERQLLSDVAASERLRIRTNYPDESGDWFWALDPNRYPHSSHLHERWTLPQARSDGVRVMLTGWGGDELASFNGRGVIPGLVRSGNLRAVWRDVSNSLPVYSKDGVTRRRLGRGFASALLSALPPEARRRVHERTHRNLYRTIHERSEAIDSALRAYSPLAADLRLSDQRHHEEIHDHRAMQMYLLGRGHIQHRTGWWYQTGRLFDVEYRYPLLDLGVVEAALSLPWLAFRSAGWRRAAFRLAVEPWVPASVAWNTYKIEPALFHPPKAGPAPRKPQGTWLTDDPRFHEVMHLASLSWDTGGPGFTSDARVVSRPELAPRA